MTNLHLNPSVIYAYSGIFETLLSFNPGLSEDLFTKNVDWIYQRIQSPLDSVKLYCAELLAIFAQESSRNRLLACERNRFEVILEQLSEFKGRDPRDHEEIEFLENCFDIVCSCLLERKAKNIFLKEEGIELMLLMLSELKMAKSRAVKVLSFAMSGFDGKECCEKLIELDGLKYIFSCFIGKDNAKYFKRYKSFSEKEEFEQVVSIIYWIFTFNLQDKEIVGHLLYRFYKKEKRHLNLLIEKCSLYFNEFKTSGSDAEYFTLQLIFLVLSYILILVDEELRESLIKSLNDRRISITDVKYFLQGRNCLRRVF